MVAGSGSGVAVTSCGLWGVDGGSLIGDISDETVVVVGGVGGGLDSAVGKGDHERSLHITTGILGLGLLEVGLGVVIVDAILVGERLGGQLFLLVGSGWAIGGRASGESHGEEGGGDNKLKKNDIIIKESKFFKRTNAMKSKNDYINLKKL